MPPSALRSQQYQCDGTTATATQSDATGRATERRDGRPNFGITRRDDATLNMAEMEFHILLLREVVLTMEEAFFLHLQGPKITW